MQQYSFHCPSPLLASPIHSSCKGYSDSIPQPLGLGFSSMELKQIVKEKKFWIASFLVVWAASLQGHMTWIKKQEAFKQKFGELRRESEPKD